MSDALAIDLGAPCFLFQGYLTKGGYGQLSAGTERIAHRYMWKLLRGPIPDGLVIDHLCRVRNCVNPQHMELVTTRENLLRGNTWQARNAAKTHCPLGHPYDAANTRITSAGGRACRTCGRYAFRRTPEYKEHARRAR